MQEVAGTCSKVSEHLAVRRCFACSYELAGLAPDGKCPECGLPVAESARRFAELDPARRRGSDLMKGARLLTLSAQLLLVMLTTGFLIELAQSLMPRGTGPGTPPATGRFWIWRSFLAQFLGLGILIGLIGQARAWWLLTRIEPIARATPLLFSRRSLARGMPIIAVIGCFAVLQEPFADAHGNVFRLPHMLDGTGGSELAIRLFASTPRDPEWLAWTLWCLMGAGAPACAMAAGWQLRSMARTLQLPSLRGISMALAIAAPIPAVVGLSMIVIEEMNAPSPLTFNPSVLSVLLLSIVVPVLTYSAISIAGLRLSSQFVVQDSFDG